MTTYLQGHADSVLRAHRWRTAANSAAFLLPHLRPGDTVLDVGCGPGSITADLARHVGPTGSVLGVDSAPVVVAAAAAEHRAPNLRFAVQDVRALAVPDASYDVVLAHQVLQHLADPVSALLELRRVVRPGGLIAVRDADYGAMSWWPPSEGMDAWRETYRSVAGRLGGQPDAGRRLLGWAQQAGLPDVVPSASTWCFATPEDRSWWGRSSADRIVSSDVARHAQELGIADAEQLAAMASAWRTWVEQDDGWFVIVHGELLCRVPA